jgi:hypothetical protein
MWREIWCEGRWQALSSIQAVLVAGQPWKLVDVTSNDWKVILHLGHAIDPRYDQDLPE